MIELFRVEQDGSPCLDLGLAQLNTLATMNALARLVIALALACPGQVLVQCQ
jgi:hypothetical protein